MTESLPEHGTLERAVRRGADRYRTLAEASALAVWRADADGGLITDMPGWRQLTGQGTEDLVGDGWLDSIPESDRPRVAATWAHSVATGEPYDVEYPIVAEDGTERRIHARGLPIREDGHIVEWVGTANDITERHRTLTQLQAEKLAVETLHDIGVTLSSELELSKVVHALTDATTNLTGAQFGAFITETGATDVAFPIDATDPVLAPTFAGEPPVRMADVGPGGGPVRSLLAVPVVSRSGRVHGGLVLGHREPGRFTERHERLVVGIASQAAIALDNAALYEAERTARAQLELLASASHRMAMSLDVADTAAALADACVPELADSAVVTLVGPDRLLEAVAVAHGDEVKRAQLLELLERYPVRLDAPYGSGAAIRTGEPSFQPIVDEELRRSFALDDDHFALLSAVAPTSIVSVPLAARGRVLGALAVRRERGPGYAEADLAIVEELARRGAVALDNARLYAQERSAGLMLQRSLLPRLLPTLPAATCAVRYLPGGAGAEVGGDWYDVLALPEDAVAVAIGDVQGRGLVAASVMGQLRAAVRAYALEDHEPREVVVRADRVVASLEDGPFATCAYARYDPATKAMVVANAGHLPPLLIDADCGARFLDLDPGLPLGVGGATFTQSSFRVEEGSVLVLFTDGLVEDAVTPLDVGMERLRTAAGAAVAEGLGCEDVADRILDELAAAGQDDDVALLVLVVGGATTDRVVELSDDPDAVGTARRAAEEAAASVDDRLVEPARRLTGQVVTDAIRHAGSAGRLRTRASGRRVRVEVIDAGGRAGDRCRGVPFDELADAWGVEPVGGGTCIWFEISAGASGTHRAPPEVPHGPAA